MSKKTGKRHHTKASQSAGISRRKLIMLPLAAATLGVAAMGINAYESSNRQLHDLQVIGQGVPVIVQIHDPGCPTCRRLKKIVSNALGSNETVAYRLADITTPAGKTLQRKYNVPHVTLLYFDRSGQHVHTTTGLQTSAQIQDAMNRWFL